MKKCKLCGKKGLFLKLDEFGYCEKCHEWKEENDKQLERKRIQKEKDKRIAKERLESIQRASVNISSEKRKRQKGYEPVKTSNITPKGVFDSFVVFDTETTGLSASRDRIVELAAVKFVKCEPIEIFHTLINPEKPIPEEATKVNHITDEMILGAPLISEILPSFEEFIGNDILVAHNLEFDLKFLFYSGSNLMDNKRKYIDTLEQAKKMLKGPKRVFDKEYGLWDYDYDADYDVDDFKLDTLCDYFHINRLDMHRADVDALATGDLFLALVNRKQI